MCCCVCDDRIAESCARLFGWKAKLQVQEIERYKWIRSEEAGHDIGEYQAASQWIRQYAKAFANWWQSVIQDIEIYKWIESEKKGHDIGLHRAIREWMTRFLRMWN